MASASKAAVAHLLDHLRDSRPTDGCGSTLCPMCTHVFGPQPEDPEELEGE